MDEQEKSAGLDRHALVLAAWLPAGFVALSLFRYGFGAGGAWWLAGGFAAILAGFVAHIVINAVLATNFSPREVALALVLFLAAALAFVLATLIVAGFAGRHFLPVTLGMAALATVVIFYMVARHGTRGAFDAFDIIRNNNPRRASSLRQGGGRR